MGELSTSSRAVHAVVVVVVVVTERRMTNLRCVFDMIDDILMMTNASGRSYVVYAWEFKANRSLIWRAYLHI